MKKLNLKEISKENLSILKGVLVILFITLIIILNNREVNKHNKNFNSNIDWQNFAGGTYTKEGLLISPLNRVIIHQDGSLGQPNPPVNLVGSHVRVEGDFEIKTEISGIDQNNKALLRFYSKPPIIYDQWRFEPGSLEVEIASSTIVVKIWDGASSNSIDVRNFNHGLSRNEIITLRHKDGNFIIGTNKKRLGTIPDHKIFDTSKEIWVGADAKEGEWILHSFIVEGNDEGKIEIIPVPSFEVKHDDPIALRNLASKHPRKIKIGSAISYSTLVTNEDYRKLAIGEFNIITPENGMKPQFIHPSKEIYTFTEMDKLVEIALKNDMQVHGHTLVYSKSSPEWMSKAKPEELKQILIDHVETVAGHFKGKVVSWDVVNEPLSTKHAAYKDSRKGIEENFWFKALGEEYIDIAFKTARQADPKAVLYLNDYGLERDGERWDALIALVKRLKNRGVPIDGIGFESHIYGDGDYSDSKALRSHMRTLEGLGLKVRISEIDVTGDDPKEQINQYQLALDVCLQAPNCTAYSTWGITDLYGSTTRSDRYPLVYGTSLLFDTNLKAKPAYSALQERLKKKY